jgi:hypothetical protein
VNITVAVTRAQRIDPPAPLPDVVETPRQAFLAGWWGGICCGALIGACAMYVLLSSIGRLS